MGPNDYDSRLTLFLLMWHDYGDYCKTASVTLSHETCDLAPAVFFQGGVDNQAAPGDILNRHTPFHPDLPYFRLGIWFG